MAEYDDVNSRMLSVEARIAFLESRVAASSRGSDGTDVYGDSVGSCFPGQSVALGGGGGGGYYPFSWDPGTKSIGSGTVMVGRRAIKVSGTGIKNQRDGTYSIKINIPSDGNPTACIDSADATSKEPTETECWIPLYVIEDGKVISDQRGSFFVMCWD